MMSAASDFLNCSSASLRRAHSETVLIPLTNFDAKATDPPNKPGPMTETLPGQEAISSSDKLGSGSTRNENQGTLKILFV